MLCNIKPVPFHVSDKHIFAKNSGGGGPDPRPPPLDPPMNNYSVLILLNNFNFREVFSLQLLSIL